jgi:ribonuclease HI
MKLLLFTDRSVNPKQGVGFGAYLELSETPSDIERLSALIKIKRFENTSSTKLELQTLLWALSQISNEEIVSYTDSRNIVGLLSRKK